MNQPAALQVPPRRIGKLWTRVVPQPVEQGLDWNKPAVFSSHTFHGPAKPRIEFSSIEIHISVAEMSIHNAAAALSLQTVLVRFAHSLQEILEVRPLA